MYTATTLASMKEFQLLNSLTAVDTLKVLPSFLCCENVIFFLERISALYQIPVCLHCYSLCVSVAHCSGGILQSPDSNIQNSLAVVDDT